MPSGSWESRVSWRKSPRGWHQLGIGQISKTKLRLISSTYFSIETEVFETKKMFLPKTWT